MISEFLCTKTSKYFRFKRLIYFIGVYAFFTLIIVPLLAPLLGRERIRHSDKINPTSFITVVLNRNYVRPSLNILLGNVEKKLKGTDISINYLDANFPFINKFPLLPHLSHNDGKKLDISLIYETSAGVITNKQKSNSGYGYFEGPNANEVDQIKKCKDKGYFQYDYPQYLTLGSINTDLEFSEKGTKRLILAILDESSLGKMFIEPHLKSRLNLNNPRVRYHGCRAVRHDDHIHIQLK